MDSSTCLGFALKAKHEQHNICTIKTSNRKLNMNNLQKKSLLFQKFQTFLQHMKSAASKQNNMTTICQVHQNKGKPYIPTHDPKLINLFDI